MKARLIVWLMVVAGLAGMAGLAFGQVTFSVGGTAEGTTNSWVVVPGRSGVANGEARVQVIAGRSDLGSSVVKFSQGLSSVAITNATATATNEFKVSAATGFAPGDVIIVQYNSTSPETYQKLVVDTFTPPTVETVTSTARALAVGDVVWRVGQVGTLPFGATTNILSNASGLFNARNGRPLLVELNSTSVGGLDLVSGEYFNGK